MVEVNDVKTVLLQQTAGLSRVQEVQQGSFDSTDVFEDYNTTIKEIKVYTPRPLWIEIERETKLKIEGNGAVAPITSFHGMDLLDSESGRREQKELDKEYVLEEAPYGSKDASSFELPQNAQRGVGDGKIFQEDEDSEKIESRQLEINLEARKKKLLSSPICETDNGRESSEETTVAVFEDEKKYSKSQEPELQQQQEQQPQQHHQQEEKQEEQSKIQSTELEQVPSENLEKPLEELPVASQHEVTKPKTEEDTKLEDKSFSDKDHMTQKEKVLSEDTLIPEQEKQFGLKDTTSSKSKVLPTSAALENKTKILERDDARDAGVSMPGDTKVKSPENKEESSNVKTNVPSSKSKALPRPTPPVVKKGIQEKDDVKNVPRTDPRRIQGKSPEKNSLDKEEAKPSEEGYFSSFVTKVLASPEVQQFKKTYLQKEEEKEKELDLEEMAEFYAKKNQEARIAQERQASSLKETPSPKDKTAAVDKDKPENSPEEKTRKISRQEDPKLAKEQYQLKTSMHTKGAERSRKRVSFEENVETKMIFSQHVEAKRHAESNAQRSKTLKGTTSKEGKDGTAHEPEGGYFSRFVSKIMAPSEEEIHLEPLKSEEDDLEKMALFYAKKNEEARKRREEEALMKEKKEAAPALSKTPPTKEEIVVPKAKPQCKEAGQAKIVTSGKKTISIPEVETVKRTEQESKIIEPEERGSRQPGQGSTQKEPPSVQSKKSESQAASKNYFSSISAWLAPQPESRESRKTGPSPLPTNDDASLEEMAAYYAKKNAEARSNLIKTQPQLSEKDHLEKLKENKESVPKQGRQRYKAQDVSHEKTKDKDLGVSKQQQLSETRHQVKEVGAKEITPKETSQKGGNVQEVEKRSLPEEPEQKKREEPQSGEGYISKFVSRVLQASEPEEDKMPRAETEDKKLEEMAAYYAKKNEEARKALQEKQDASAAAQGKVVQKETERMKSDSSAKKISDELVSEDKLKTQLVAGKSSEMASTEISGASKDNKQTQEISKPPQGKKEKEKLEDQAVKNGAQKPPESKGSGQQPAETGYFSRFMTKVKASYDAYQETPPQPAPPKADDEEDLEKMAAFFAKQNQEARLALQKKEEKKKLQQQGSKEREIRKYEQQEAPLQQLGRPQAGKEIQTSANSKMGKEDKDTKLGGNNLDQSNKEKGRSGEEPRDASLTEIRKVTSQGITQPKPSDPEPFAKREEKSTLDQKQTRKLKTENVADKSGVEEAAQPRERTEELKKPVDKTKVDKNYRKNKGKRNLQTGQKLKSPRKKPRPSKPVDKPPETVSEAVSGLMKWGKSMFK